VFFFEKKNQKTFALALWPPDVSLRPLARNQTSKSVLVLFFKKEHFLRFAPRAQRGPTPALRCHGA
jgi:hypothetical protein